MYIRYFDTFAERRAFIKMIGDDRVVDIGIKTSKNDPTDRTYWVKYN